MKKKIRVVVVLLVVAAGVTFAALRAGWWKTENGSVIRLSGNIELEEVDISFKLPGRLVERRVTEGATVKKGMVLAQIDRASSERQRAREQAGVESAVSALAQSRTAVDYQRSAIENDVALKQADLRQAEAALRDLQAGSRPQEVEQARSAAADAKVRHEQARRDWERAQTLFKNEDISAAQHDQFRTAFDSTAAALRQSEERLALVVEGPRKETIEMARAQVDRGRAALRLAETNRLELKRREQEVPLRQAEIARAQAQVAIVDAQLDDTVAVSPVDGVVLVKSAEPGEVVAAGTTILTIGDLDHPWLRGYVNEKDLGKVKLGMKAKLTTDSYPGKVYWGRVTFISAEAEFTPKQIQTQEERVKLVYRIKIEVDNPAHELKSNMPVDAEIVLQP